MRSRVLPVLSFLIVALSLGVRAQESFIAYENPPGTAGTQIFGGALGMDFDVEVDIRVTRLGVFDELSDGLNLPITARLYDRDTLLELASLEFTPVDPGELIGGSRFKDLAAALDLPAGFHGAIVAEGYGVGERNGNQGAADLGLRKDSGGCAISFVGTGRWIATPGLFPDVIDEGPANRYAAGTFVFEPQEDPPAPRGGTAYVVEAGTLGNDTFGGALGMDFDVNVDLLVTRLGVFDSGSDGLNTTITARLYDRDSGIELASLEFTPADPGELIGGSRFKDLPESFGLPAGLRGTIVAEGYSDVEMNGNQSLVLDGLTTDTGDCAIEFVGRGRTGLTPGEFPDAVVFAPPNSPNPFAAGTFAFEPSATPIERPLPPTNVQATGEDGRIRLSWSPPAGGPAVAGYNVYQTRPGALTKINPVLVTATSFTVSGLLGGVEHCFLIRSMLATGIEGESSEEVCGTPTVEGLPEETAIAYQVAAGTVGNQGDFSGALGMDFDANTDIVVTRLGVFDDGSDGLNATITARLYDRDLQLEVASLVFTPDDPGDLVGGSRFKDLDPPVSLPGGFRGTVVAEGYRDDDPLTEDVDEREMNGNRTAGPMEGLTTDDLSCTISFVGSRFGAAGAFPATFQIAPVIDAYAAGTFEYGPVEQVEPPMPGGIAYLVEEGVAGNQDFGGALGMDFNVEADILITRLGVFDDSSDGLFLPISARLYDRDSQRVFATVDFTPADPGELVGGSRFKDLVEPVGLPPGFQGTIVASGYGVGELNGNQQGAAMALPGLGTDDGGCLITFVGGGRFGDEVTPGVFPGIQDTGPANRYAAGTFAFEPSDEPIILPPNPPQGIRVDAGDGEILLSWTAPGGTTPAARYRVFRALAGEAFAEVAEVDETEFLDSGLANGQEFCYRLRSIAASGEESEDTPPICATPGALVEGRTIAYPVPGGTAGTEPGVGEVFGLDFDVHLDVRVTRFGVFDAGTDGLSGDLLVRLFDRDTQEELRIVEFSAADPGILIGGSRFKDIDPLDLPAGFHGSIVADGFTELDPVATGVNLPTDPGPCSLSFVAARRDVAGFFPLAIVPGIHPFACASLEFEALELLEPRDGGIAYINPALTFGNQAFSGPLGMDFNVQHPIRVTRLGVFDDGSDGLNLPLNARLYDRDTREVLARLDFTPEDPGDPVDGSWFKTLPTPVALPAGFHGAIVGQGYGDTERNGNQGAFDLGLLTDDGGCLIAFVGGARYGDPLFPDGFPDQPDGGPANRYAAGTFEFERGAPAGVAFVRGDGDSSRQINLTDGIGALNWLFLGGPVPACLDAADTDDSGTVNLTDAVQIFNWLFTGGPPPAAPSPSEGRYPRGDCAEDPTGDALTCETTSETCAP